MHYKNEHQRFVATRQFLKCFKEICKDNTEYIESNFPYIDQREETEDSNCIDDFFDQIDELLEFYQKKIDAKNNKTKMKKEIHSPIIERIEYIVLNTGEPLTCKQINDIAGEELATPVKLVGLMKDSAKVKTFKMKTGEYKDYNGETQDKINTVYAPIDWEEDLSDQLADIPQVAKLNNNIDIEID